VPVLSQGLAAVLRETTGPSGVRLEEREATALLPGHVRLGVRAASLNHLDLWVASGAQRVGLPRVLGADAAGVVLESDAPGWSVGQEALVYPVLCCWRCAACRAGEQVLCPDFGILGEHGDGTAATQLQVPGSNLYPKPEGLSWVEAAAIPLTFLTAWRMLRRAGLHPGDRLLVVGAGAGVANAALALGLHLGARVAVTSRSKAKLERALELGAEAAFSSQDFAAGVRSWSPGGVDVVFEHVGPATIEQSLRCLRRAGRLVLCGSTTGSRAEINLARLFLGQGEILGSTMGNAGEFAQVLEAVAQGVRPIVDSVHPLERVEAALSRLEAQEQFGKVVLEMPS